MLKNKNEKPIVAEFTVGDKTVKITISDLDMTSCVARIPFRVKPYQQAKIRLGNKGEDTPTNSTVKCLIESVSQKRLEPNTYYAKLKFKDFVKANQGIVQLIHETKNKQTDDNHKNSVSAVDEIESNRSIQLVSVNCHMCGQTHIPFRKLKSQKMVVKNNIFGVPFYFDAMPDEDFCDYNFIQVGVCPTCLFASNNIKDFSAEISDGKYTLASFSSSAIAKRWKAGYAKRKKLLALDLDGFFRETRTLKQAVLSYDLAIIASDEIFSTDKSRHSRLREYYPARKSVFYLMVKAELLIVHEQVKAAEKALHDAVIRLEKIFPYLVEEPSIRAAYLLGMVNLYFGRNQKMEHYVNFLSEYNQDESLDDTSNEFKTLMRNYKNLKDAYQNRDDFHKDNLHFFIKPY